MEPEVYNKNPLEDPHVYWLLLTFILGIVLLLILLWLMNKQEEKECEKKWSNKTSHGISKESYDTEVIIVGSGILGSALATTLAKTGRNVMVVEKDLKEPDRIVGELLQPGGCEALRKLGLQGCIEDLDANKIHGYVIHNNASNTEVVVPYAATINQVKSGRAFHYGRFVQSLRKTAKESPGVTYMEGTVTKLTEENKQITGIEYREKDTGTVKNIKAPLTIVADGCFSKFRKGLVKETPTVKSHFVGMLMTDCPESKTNFAEIVLADPNPVLIYKISSRKTRILVDIRGGMPKNIKDYFKKIYPELPEHIQGPFIDAVEMDHIRSMPNNFLPPVPLEKPGVLCLGDAFNMRHPLTGGGMSVALNDVLLVRDLFQDIPDLSNHKAVIRASRILYLRRKNNHSFVVNILAQALYELFAAEDEYLKRLKAACFAYFQLGGECVAGPVGLLSVLNPKPYILLGHFFAVAFYAIFHTFRSEGWSSIHKAIMLSCGIFSKAVYVITPLVWSEMKTVVRYY